MQMKDVLISAFDASQMIIGDMDHYHIYKTLHSTHKCT